jgi:hypothetical protein
MQVTDSPTPNIADIKRQLNNTTHELDELVNTTVTHDPLKASDLSQALFRVREAIAHLEAAEKGRA